MAPLSQRVLEAAAILEEVSRVYDYAHPPHAPWSAADLRREAAHIAAEEADAPGRDLTIYTYVYGTVETTVRVPDDFDVNDEKAVEELWYAQHDYGRDVMNMDEVTVDHDKTVSLDEFE